MLQSASLSPGQGLGQLPGTGGAQSREGACRVLPGLSSPILVPSGLPTRGKVTKSGGHCVHGLPPVSSMPNASASLSRPLWPQPGPSGQLVTPSTPTASCWVRVAPEPGTTGSSVSLTPRQLTKCPFSQYRRHVLNNVTNYLCHFRPRNPLSSEETPEASLTK